MNKKAKDIGCKNTNFANAHGYHDINHYSTAYDMALLMNYAAKNNVFREICETGSYVMGNNRKLTSTNLLLKEELNYKYGGKTGFTNEAGNVIVSYAIKDNITLICTLFDGAKSIYAREPKFTDTNNLFNYAFENYTNKKIIDKKDLLISVYDKKENSKYTLELKEDISCLSDTDFFMTNYIPSITNDDFKVDITAGNDTWNLNETYDLIIVDKEYLPDYTFAYILITIGILLLFVLIVRLKFNKRKNK